MVNNKKIIFLLPVWGGGGGERVASDLSFNLPDFIEKIIVAFESKNYYPYKGKLISLHLPLSTKPMLKLFNFLKGYFRFRKIILKERPDYVVSFGSLQNMINILSFKKSIIRVDNPISISHERIAEKMYPFLVELFFNRAHKIIVVSKGLQEELVEKFHIKKEKIVVIHNSIDTMAIKQLTEEDLEPHHREIFRHPVIINIGSLIGQKGHIHLIRAFKKAKETITDTKLVILGEGILDSYLSQEVKKLDLENEVYFLGWQKNPFKFLARSKVFVLSSMYEGFGIVLLEAMACSVPVISSDCDFGPREILAPNMNRNDEIKDMEKGEYGILVPVPKTDEAEAIMAKAMVNLCNDANLAKELREASQKRIRDFQIAQLIKRHEFLWKGTSSY